MLRYQDKAFNSLVHLHQVTSISQKEEGEFLIVGEIVLKNKEIELPATFKLEYLKKPVFSINLEVLSDLELLHAAIDCLLNISTMEKVKKLITNMELFLQEVKYRINDRFFEAKAEIEVVKRDVHSLLSKMPEVKKVLNDINDYIKSLKIEDDTKALYNFCLHAFFRWLFFFKTESFPSINIADLNTFLKEYEASNSYKILCVKQVLRIIARRGETFNPESINWPQYSFKQPTLLSPNELRELEEVFLINVGTQRRQIEDYNQYLHSIGEIPHSYSRLRDLIRNWLYFRLAAESLMKANELISLDFKDIDFDKLRIHMRKRGANEKIAITKDTADLFKLFQRFRNNYDADIEEEKYYLRIQYGKELKEKSAKEAEIAQLTSHINALERIELNQLVFDLEQINKRIHQLKELTRHQQRQESDSLGDLRKERKLLNAKYARLYAILKRKYDSKSNEDVSSIVFISSHTKRVHQNTMEKILNRVGITTEDLRYTRFQQLINAGIEEKIVKRIAGSESDEAMSATTEELEKAMARIEKIEIDWVEKGRVEEIIKEAIINDIINRWQDPAVDELQLRKELKEKYEDYDFDRQSLIRKIYEREYTPLKIEKKRKRK